MPLRFIAVFYVVGAILVIALLRGDPRFCRNSAPTQSGTESATRLTPLCASAILDLRSRQLGWVLAEARAQFVCVLLALVVTFLIERND